MQKPVVFLCRELLILPDYNYTFNFMNILKEKFEIDYFGNRVEISRYCYTTISLYRFDMKNGLICNLYEYDGKWRFEDKEHSEIAQEIGEMIEQHYSNQNG